MHLLQSKKALDSCFERWVVKLHLPPPSSRLGLCMFGVVT